MDPVTVKFIQLIAAQVFGVVLSFAGIWLFLRGASGKMTLLVEGMGMKARLTNATPGGIVFLLGCAIVVMAVTVPSVERDTRTTEGDPEAGLNEWLDRSRTVPEDASYGEVQDAIWGPEAVRRARVETLKLSKATTLGDLALEKHGDSRFWPLLATINQDRDYISRKEASATTQVPAGAVIEVWHPSRFYGTTTETRVRVAGPTKDAAYAEIAALIESGAQWGEDVTFSDLDERFRDEELSLVHSPAVRDGAQTLRELSLKYYGSVEYWPLIAWVNDTAFGPDVSGSTPLPNEELTVIHFLP